MPWNSPVFAVQSTATSSAVKNGKSDHHDPSNPLPGEAEREPAAGDTNPVDSSEARQHYWVLRDINFLSPLVLDKNFTLVQTKILEDVNVVQIHSLCLGSKQDLSDAKWLPKDWELHFVCQFSKYPITKELKAQVRILVSFISGLITALKQATSMLIGFDMELGS